MDNNAPIHERISYAEKCGMLIGLIEITLALHPDSEAVKHLKSRYDEIIKLFSNDSDPIA